MWFYKQSIKDKGVRDLIKAECIGYRNWVDSLPKNGWPRNENGSMMTCWQLYDFYIHSSNKRDIYYNHAIGNTRND